MPEPPPEALENPLEAVPTGGMPMPSSIPEEILAMLQTSGGAALPNTIPLG
jgi:hypothetical protein